MNRSRDDIELNLAFAVNGTLSAAEQAEIDALMASDAALRADHDALAAIRAQMQAEEVASPGAFGLARLMRDAGREERVVAAPPAPNRTWMWQLAAAAAVLAFLGQSVLIGRGPEPVSGSGGYQMAGVGDGAAMIVSFAPDATEEQIRGLLVGLNVQIISGPSALGFYGLDVVGGADHTAAAEELRQATGIVDSVETAER